MLVDFGTLSEIIPKLNFKLGFKERLWLVEILLQKMCKICWTQCKIFHPKVSYR